MSISIKEPCNEDWSKMTPNERGAHCQRCALNVIDFTHKTAFEIKSILSEELSSNNRVCGRITNYQLDQLNDDYFHWKNDHESFKAVLIFSLIAVFGLSLFSCQHAPTRELIHQLNIESSVVLNEEKALDIELNDSIAKENSSDSIKTKNGIQWNPEIVTYMGVVPHEFPQLEVGRWEICKVIYGDFIVSGSILAEPKQEIEDFLLGQNLLHPIGTTGNTSKKRQVNHRPERQRSRIEGINTSGEKLFDALIYPNPIEESSRLFVYVNVSTSIDITLWRAKGPSPLRHAIHDFETGRFQIDLKLYQLQSGEYELKLMAGHQLSVLVFEV